MKNLHQIYEAIQKQSSFKTTRERIIRAISVFSIGRVLKEPRLLLDVLEKTYSKNLKIGLIGGGIIATELLKDPFFREKVKFVFDRDPKNCLASRIHKSLNINYVPHLDKTAIKEVDLAIISSVEGKTIENFLGLYRICKKTLTLLDLATLLPPVKNAGEKLKEFTVISDFPYKGIPDALDAIFGNDFTFFYFYPLRKPSFIMDLREKYQLFDLKSLLLEVERINNLIFFQPIQFHLELKYFFNCFAREISQVLKFIFNKAKRKFLWLIDDYENHNPKEVLLLINMARNSDGIIIKNPPEHAKRVLTKYNVKKPIYFFPRYPKFLKNPEPKSVPKDNFHLAVMNKLLPGSEKSNGNENIHGLVKKYKIIAEQGIKLHFFIDPDLKRDLLEIFEKYNLLSTGMISIHASISNRCEFLKKISQYHAGIYLDNNENMENIISMAFWDCIQACLPIITNRALTTNVFPKDFMIYFNTKEIHKLKSLLLKVNWRSKYSEIERKRFLFSLEANVEGLKKWFFT